MSTGKKQRKKQKHRVLPVKKSHIAIRLDKLRNCRRKNLWSDDDDEDNVEKSQPLKVTFLSSSEEEGKPSRKRKTRSHTPKNATCLLCSILPSLSAKNCCAEHLSLLQLHSHRRSQQTKHLAAIDENIQHNLEQQQQGRTSPMIIDLTDSLPPTNSSLPPLASTIVIEPGTRKSPEHPTTTEENPITTIDNPPSQTTTTNQPLHNPWSPMSDEIIEAVEKAVEPIDISSDSPLEYTPTTARRTETEVMAARLPKIPLKPGRFRHGRPIVDRSTSTNAANEYRPLAAPTVLSPPTCVNTETRDNNVFTQDESCELATTTVQANEDDPHTANARTPSRISFRLNPDGTRVSISRPALPTNAQSPPLHSLRRTSTDVTPFSKQM